MEALLFFSVMANIIQAVLLWKLAGRPASKRDDDHGDDRDEADYWKPKDWRPE